MELPNKTCGNCKYCRKMIPMREGLDSLWICNEYDDDEYATNVTPPYDEACEKWEEAKTMQLDKHLWGGPFPIHHVTYFTKDYFESKTIDDETEI